MDGDRENTIVLITVSASSTKSDEIRRVVRRSSSRDERDVGAGWTRIRELEFTLNHYELCRKDRIDISFEKYSFAQARQCRVFSRKEATTRSGKFDQLLTHHSFPR